MHAPASILLVAVVFSNACAPSKPGPRAAVGFATWLRRRAALDFSCPSDEIRIERVCAASVPDCREPDGASALAHGCGQSSRYDYVCRTPRVGTPDCDWIR